MKANRILVFLIALLLVFGSALGFPVFTRVLLVGFGIALLYQIIMQIRGLIHAR